MLIVKHWKIRLKCVVWLSFETLLLWNRSASIYDKWYGNILIQSKHIGQKTWIQAAKSGGMQDPVLFLKILTIWDWKMAISPSCLTFCVYMYLYVHTQYPLNFSPLPGRIIAISLHLYIHLLECVMFNAWESWLGSAEKNIFFQKFEPLLWSVFISRK